MKPSRVRDRFWLQAWAPNSVVTPRVGKWLLHIPAPEVDAVWEQVLRSLEAGRLGPSAKVRTAVPHPFYSNRVKVICVYTKDAEDAVDKARVRLGLYRLGFIEPLTYRTDAETLAGKECI